MASKKAHRVKQNPQQLHTLLPPAFMVNKGGFGENCMKKWKSLGEGSKQFSTSKYSNHAASCHLSETHQSLSPGNYQDAWLQAGGWSQSLCCSQEPSLFLVLFLSPSPQLRPLWLEDFREGKCRRGLSLTQFCFHLSWRSLWQGKLGYVLRIKRGKQVWHFSKWSYQREQLLFLKECVGKEIEVRTRNRKTNTSASQQCVTRSMKRTATTGIGCKESSDFWEEAVSREGIGGNPQGGWKMRHLYLGR